MNEMTTKTSAKLLLALLPAATLLATSAWADTCTPVTSTSCASGTSCTTLTGSYTNTTGKKIKQAEIVALSGEDGKQLAAVMVVFTGTTTTLYDPNSNTPPSGLGSGSTATYSMSTPYPLAAMDTPPTCQVQQIW
jgi:hypothetical protein